MTFDITADPPGDTETDTETDTDPETGAEETPGDGPSVIYTAYFTAAEELVEHIRAADVLNLGFRVESYLVASDEVAEAGQIEFEFTLLSELPVRGD